MDDRNALSYILNHVFLPPKLPQEEDSNLANDISLCRFVYDASCIFTGFLTEAQQSRWSVVCQMLKILLRNTKALNKDVIVQNMLSLENGGLFPLLYTTLFIVILTSLPRSFCIPRTCSECRCHSTQALLYCDF